MLISKLFLLCFVQGKRSSLHIFVRIWLEFDLNPLLSYLICESWYVSGNILWLIIIWKYVYNNFYTCCGDHSWFSNVSEGVSLFFPYDAFTPAWPAGCTAGRVDVPLCASSCLLPPPLCAQLALSLVETGRKRGRELGSWDLSSSARPANFTTQPLRRTRHHFKPPKILRPVLFRRLWCFGEVRTNLRTLLPHFSHFPQSSRKYSAEGIGVRMATYRLVLIRHGESCWNQENRFCGWFDADLSETGEHEAKRGGQALKGTVTDNVTGPNRACRIKPMQASAYATLPDGETGSIGPLRHKTSQQQRGQRVRMGVINRVYLTGRLMN